MALAGLHIVCSRVAVRSGATLPIYPDWSETIALGGTTVNTALDGNSILLVSAGPADAHFAVGKNPVANLAVGTGESARYFIRAGQDKEVFCNTGDKLTCVAA